MNKEFNSVENNREREYNLANELAKNIILKFLSGEYEEEEVNSEIEKIEEKAASPREKSSSSTISMLNGRCRLLNSRQGVTIIRRMLQMRLHSSFLMPVAFA